MDFLLNREDFCRFSVDVVDIQNFALEINGFHDARERLLRRSAGSDLTDNWDLGLALLLCLDRGPGKASLTGSGRRKGRRET